ncbi:MAG: metallophosphoesterase [Ktedonobacteraceae bacterium]|nr:metallophosphoesterase [Ktedonobacteraceae bacterium]
MQEASAQENRELFSFWAFGDLHYRAQPAWHEVHTRRLAPMFQDLRRLWQEQGPPAFCVSPGDIVETCARENYQVARASLEEHLDGIPFYAGVGNHEYHGPDGEDPAQMAAIFTEFWGKPVRYTWQVEQAPEVVCIMLDYPDPHNGQADPERIVISRETLDFLDTSLREHADQLALIFLHCPLYDTVLDRDPARRRDYHSLQHFFAPEPESSQQVRDILARHKHASLVFSGHTHSGWEAPGLVKTEQLGGYPVTFVNLMSPWYTGRGSGNYTGKYLADDPDMIPSFSIRIYPEQASIRVREHRMRRWLKEWQIPLR